MARKTIITINAAHYLVPDDQAKDLTGLLSRLSDWQSVKPKDYGQNEWVIDEKAEPTIGVKLLLVENIDDGKPKAVLPTEAPPVSPKPKTEEVPF